jgi:signal transduction histidine kinase
MSAGSEKGRGAALRVACPIEDEATRRTVEQAILVWLPQVELADDATPAVREAVRADALVLAAPAPGEPALDVLRRARATGFDGAVVVVVPPAAAGSERVAHGDATPTADWRRLGGCPCMLGEGAGERLARALVESLQANGPATDAGAPADRGVAALRDELWETRRRLAVAEVAVRLQHTLNNPLAAMLAEAQLLEMESLPAEHRAAVRRIVALCRRMTEVVRTLDVAREAVPRPADAAADTTTRHGRVSGDWFGPGVG